MKNGSKNKIKSRSSFAKRPKISKSEPEAARRPNKKGDKRSN